MPNFRKSNNNSHCYSCIAVNNMRNRSALCNHLNKYSNSVYMTYMHGKCVDILCYISFIVEY